MISPEMAVALAVADNQLEGFETAVDALPWLLKVANGELSGDDAVRGRFEELGICAPPLAS